MCAILASKALTAGVARTRITQFYLPLARLSTSEINHIAFTPQLQSITALWPLPKIIHQCRSRDIFWDWDICQDTNVKACFSHAVSYKTAITRGQHQLAQKDRQTHTRPLFPGQLGKPAQERLNQSEFNEAKDIGVAVASAGPYAIHLHLAADR